MNISIPIMAMTASALKGEKTKCIEMGMSDYLTKPFNFSFLYERINFLLEKKDQKKSVQNIAPQNSNNLFDLSLLEEMDDNEYLCEILYIFLNKTPVELNELKKAASRHESDNVYKIAHKLKSSAGLLKANELLSILVKIEEYASENKNIELPELVKQADATFRKIESHLQKRLINISEEHKLALKN